MSADDLESLQETVFWLSQPGIRDDIAAAERQYREGTTVSGDALREEFGLPPSDVTGSAVPRRGGGVCAS